MGISFYVASAGIPRTPIPTHKYIMLNSQLNSTPIDINVNPEAIESNHLVESLNSRLQVDSRTLEFLDPAVEQAYRDSRRKVDRLMLLLTCAAAMIVQLLFLWSDINAYLQLLPGAYVALIGRGVVVMILLGTCIAALGDYRELHRLSVVIISALTFIVLNIIISYDIPSYRIEAFCMYWLVINVMSAFLMPFTFRTWCYSICIQFAGLIVTCWIFLPEVTMARIYYSTIIPVIAMITVTLLSRRQQREGRLHYASLCLAQALSTELVMIANSDPLTGAANRRYFDTVATHEWARAQRNSNPLCLLILDIDHFKNINDHHGHPAGDAVLCAIVKLLKTSVREIDTVARLGGEEFAVLLPDTGIDTAREVAERIRRSCETTPILYEDKKIGFTLSIGVAGVTDISDNIDKLIQNADAALYEAKRNGRNCMVIAAS